MKHIKNILFDLDGTLIESEEGIINSILYSLEKMNLKVESKDSLKKFIGPPLKNSYIEYFKLLPEDAAMAVNFFREYFSEKGIYENFLYDGIKDLLISLKKLNFKLFIATSKPTVYSEQILIYHKISELFEGIIGCNLDHTRVEKTEIIAYILDTYKLNYNDCIMIGDREHDISGAQNNGLKTIAVTYGHGSLKELNDSDPDYSADSPKEIFSIFTN